MSQIAHKAQNIRDNSESIKMHSEIIISGISLVLLHIVKPSRYNISKVFQREGNYNSNKSTLVKNILVIGRLQ